MAPPAGQQLLQMKKELLPFFLVQTARFLVLM
jgi:hypothetical protein